MKKIGKKYKLAKEAMPSEKQSKTDAISLCKNNATANFDESVDVAFSLGIDTKDAEQNIVSAGNICFNCLSFIDPGAKANKLFAGNEDVVIIPFGA